MLLAKHCDLLVFRVPQSASQHRISHCHLPQCIYFCKIPLICHLVDQ